MKFFTKKSLRTTLDLYANKDIPPNVDLWPLIQAQIAGEITPLPEQNKQKIRPSHQPDHFEHDQKQKKSFWFGQAAVATGLVMLFVIFIFGLFSATQPKSVATKQLTQTFAAVPLVNFSPTVTPLTLTGSPNPGNSPLVLHPVSYTTTVGYDGQQSAAVLSIRDQTGTQNDWNKYVEFKPLQSVYEGYRTYLVPASFNLSAGSRLEVRANFEGLAQPEQVWTWQLYNWHTNKGDNLGTNAATPDWFWSEVSFKFNGNLTDYVGPNRQIRLILASNNNADSLDLDYEEIAIY